MKYIQNNEERGMDHFTELHSQIKKKIVRFHGKAGEPTKVSL